MRILGIKKMQKNKSSNMDNDQIDKDSNLNNTEITNQIQNLNINQEIKHNNNYSKSIKIIVFAGSSK
jgi:hypothetical protein